MIELEQYKPYIKIILFLIIGTVIIILISVLATSNTSNSIDTYFSIKEEHKDDTTNFTSYLPNVKFSSDDAKKVNEEIEQDFNNALDYESMFTYQVDLNDNYLSLATFYIYNDINDNNYPKTIIRTYNFNLDTGNLVTDTDLLKEFSVTESDIVNTLEQEFTNYYKQELESMYFTEAECNYDCFLDLRGIDSYSDNVFLYVVNNELHFYRPFAIYSRYEDEQFYRHEDFLFEIDK